MIDKINKRGGLIWITGYSGAGKTTVAEIVSRELKQEGFPVLLLDGDDLRNIFGEKYGFDMESRKKLAYIYSRLCKRICDDGINVVIATIAMFESVRIENRESNLRYLEVYLDVPFEVRAERDPKGIYLAAKKKSEVTYSSVGLEEPKNPDIIIKNHGENIPKNAANLIVETFKRNFSDNKGPELVPTAAVESRLQYWDSYYKKREAPINPSAFAIFCDENFLAKQIHILEFGCGNGRDSFYLAKKHRVTGIDESIVAIQTNKTRAKNEGVLNVDFIHGEFGKATSGLPNEVDAIYARFVMHDVPLDAEMRVLNASWALLKPGGQILLEFITDKDQLMKKRLAISNDGQLTDHYRRFINFEDFCNRLSSIGFSIDYSLENNGLAIHGDDNPTVGRVVAIKL